MPEENVPEENPTYTVSSVVRLRQRRPPPSLSGPRDVYVLMHDRLKHADREHIYALLLNTKNVLIAAELVSIGSISATIIHPREILKPAIIASAACIILVHNHPTGDPTPSNEDVEFTKRFAKCGKLIGIELLDHIVIGNGHFYSLKQHGRF